MAAVFLPGLHAAAFEDHRIVREKRHCRDAIAALQSVMIALNDVNGRRGIAPTTRVACGLSRRSARLADVKYKRRPMRVPIGAGVRVRLRDVDGAHVPKAIFRKAKPEPSFSIRREMDIGVG